MTAGVQPRQDPGGTLRMNSVDERERRYVRPALIGPSLQGRQTDQMGVAAESGRVWQCFILYCSFYTLS